MEEFIACCAAAKAAQSGSRRRRLLRSSLQATGDPYLVKIPFGQWDHVVGMDPWPNSEGEHTGERRAQKRIDLSHSPCPRTRVAITCTL
jgi:hypothetical protein